MASTSITIARLRQLRVPVAWQEAVEVARLAGMAAEQLQAAITLDGCWIGTDGSVELAHARGAAGELSVMQLLATLLDGQTAPPELVTLVMLGDETPSGFTTPEQGRPKGLSLEWFVRPNPEIEVARLATRALAAESTAAGAASIAELQAKVAEQAPRTADGPVADARGARPWLRHTVAAAAVTVALGAAWLAWTRWGHAIAPTAASENDASPLPAMGPGAATPAARTARAASPASRTASADPSPPSIAAARAGRRSTGVPAADAAVETSTPPAHAAGAPVAAAPESLEGMAASATSDGSVTRVYTAGDEGVDAPMMVYPQLPSAPRADSRQSDAYIDVLVDERGQVQQVRLRSNDPTLNDRMIVAAAKAWHFEPARKDGVPVKYFLSVPVTR